MIKIENKYITYIGIVLIAAGILTGATGIILKRNYYLDVLEFLSLGTLLFLNNKRIKGEVVIKCISLVICLTAVILKVGYWITI